MEVLLLETQGEVEVLDMEEELLMVTLGRQRIEMEKYISCCWNRCERIAKEKMSKLTRILHWDGGALWVGVMLDKVGMMLQIQRMSVLDTSSSKQEIFHPKNKLQMSLTLQYFKYVTKNTIKRMILTSSVRIVATTFTISLKCSRASTEK